MSAVASTDADSESASLLERAARGILPPWAEVSEGRRAHIERVVALLDEWAAALDLDAAERQRWRAAGWLHDALRDADPRELRAALPDDWRDFPPPLLHGPAAAERLADAVDDGVRAAVRYHTIGHPDLDRAGQALYLADFLEPGRDFEEERRASLRARMPHAMNEVLREVIAARIRYLLEGRKPIRPETAAFWTRMVSESA